MEIIGLILLLIGGIFLFLGGLGIFRMPDTYNRLQAGTKATTLGGMSVILGVGFLEPGWIIKAMVLVIFIAFSNPISSHALARANYKRKNYPYLKGGAEYDQYREVYVNQENKEENK
ncbi:MAG: monovalent cation/H(+) antiporter subunit G [Chlorobi bacterium]|nr:monovalent cation/H(+) antiporter subunit G [Chlorobiota bacterium]